MLFESLFSLLSLTLLSFLRYSLPWLRRPSLFQVSTLFLSSSAVSALLRVPEPSRQCSQQIRLDLPITCPPVFLDILTWTSLGYLKLNTSGSELSPKHSSSFASHLSWWHCHLPSHKCRHHSRFFSKPILPTLAEARTPLLYISLSSHNCGKMHIT